MSQSKCAVCNGEREIVSFTSAGYDHPPTRTRVPCPACTKKLMLQADASGARVLFPMIKPKLPS